MPFLPFIPSFSHPPQLRFVTYSILILYFRANSTHSRAFYVSSSSLQKLSSSSSSLSGVSLPSSQLSIVIIICLPSANSHAIYINSSHLFIAMCIIQRHQVEYPSSVLVRGAYMLGIPKLVVQCRPRTTTTTPET